MNMISSSAKALAAVRAVEGSAEQNLGDLEHSQINPAVSPKQASAPMYRHAKKSPSGQTIWVQGQEVSPAVTAGDMRGLARHAVAVAFQDARAGRSLRWSDPSLFLDGRTVIGGETIRTPSEHRAILAALDEVKKPNEQTVAELARSIADAWEGK
jgi:hypothetical protein